MVFKLGNKIVKNNVMLKKYTARIHYKLKYFWLHIEKQLMNLIAC